MGIVNSFHTLSTLISSGYACLVDFRQQADIKSTPVARVSFMPDPVCATLAMRFMNENWRFGELKGKGRKFWVEQAEKAFTTKLCLPDKDDAGEILPPCTCFSVVMCFDKGLLHPFQPSWFHWTNGLTS